MAPPPNATPAIGINGLHYRPADGNIYSTNSLREQFNRVPIAITGNPSKVTAAGEYTTVAGGIFGDDFARQGRDCLHCCKSDERGLQSDAEG